MSRGAKKATAPAVDYSGISAGMRLQAESGGTFYAAEVVQVNLKKPKPIKVRYVGYTADSDEWLAADRIKSRALGKPGASKKKDKPKEGEGKVRTKSSVLRFASYHCHPGKEEDFKRITDHIIKEFEHEVEGFNVVNSMRPAPDVFSFVMSFKTQEFLDKYKETIKAKYVDELKPCLDTTRPAYDMEGPTLDSFRKKGVPLEPGKGVMRVVCYKAKEGQDKEFEKVGHEVLKIFQKKVEGESWIAWCRAPCGTYVFGMNFESMEQLEKYKHGVREELMEKLRAVMDGDAVYDECGLVHAVTPKPRPIYKTIEELWKEHTAAYLDKDLNKLMFDYDEASKVYVYTFGEAGCKEYKGTKEIRAMFTDTFDHFKEDGSISLPPTAFVEVDEEGRLVYLVRSEGGMPTTVDTVTFRKAWARFKISRHTLTLCKK